MQLSFPLQHTVGAEKKMNKYGAAERISQSTM